MKHSNILILGGYGQTGRLITHCLLRESNVHITLAGRHMAKAQQTAEQLNQRFGNERVSTLYADAADPTSLTEAFAGGDMVVVASSTADYAQNVATAALHAGIDYLDIQYSAKKTAVLRTMSHDIDQAGCCFVTDGGFHPGLPAALVRYTAPCFDQLESANVGSVIKLDWSRLELGQETMVEFVKEFLDFQTLAFRNGRWRKVSLLTMMKPATMDFGEKFGRQSCIPMYLEEMRAIPQLLPGIQETGFFVGSFNWFTDWIVTPFILLALKLAPRRGLSPAARLFRWSLNRFSRPPYGTMLKLEARGKQDGWPQTMTMTLYHDDGYVLTAVPVVATLLQLIDGSARQPGLHYQAHIVQPGRLIKDMARMGIEIRVRYSAFAKEATEAVPSGMFP